MWPCRLQSCAHVSGGGESGEDDERERRRRRKKRKKKREKNKKRSSSPRDESKSNTELITALTQKASDALINNEEKIEQVLSNPGMQKILLETPDHVKEMVEGKKMGPRMQPEFLAKKLNKVFEKADTTEPSSQARVRKAQGLPTPQFSPPSHAKPMVSSAEEKLPARIACVSSSPTNEADNKALDFQTECELMRELIRVCPKFQCSTCRASEEQMDAAVGSKCFCLHCSGHGHPEKGLCIEGDPAIGKPGKHLDGKALAEMFRRNRNGRPKIVHLAACHSEIVGKKLTEDGSVSHVMACRGKDELSDHGAPVFAGTFHQRLPQGHSALEAFELAKRRLRVTAQQCENRALFCLEEHPKPSLIAAKLEEKLKSLHAQCTTHCAKWKVERDFRVFCKKENIDQEVQEELLWADLAENEVDKLTLLPRSTDNDEIHNVKCEFRELEQIEPKTGWIPDPDPGSFFSRDAVKEQCREILENCRLSMRQEDC
eukprot:jgi/Bigna1/137400/aug1.39_g12108